MNLPASLVNFTGWVRPWRNPLMVGMACVGALAGPTKADLVVLNAAGPASYLLRLDAATGAAQEVFRQETEAYYSLTLSPQNELMVSANTLGEFSFQTFGADRAYRGSIGHNRTSWWGGTRGPDGAVYALGTDHASAGTTGNLSVWRIAGGEPQLWISAGSGGMTAPVGFVFGPEGDLYVADARAGVLRFGQDHGTARGVFVPLGRGGLQDVAKLSFGPDGHLYVASQQANAVLRFDGQTGEVIDTFVTAGAGGLVGPAGLAFGPDGYLYVTSAGTNQILRFDGTTGAALGVVATAAGTPGDPRLRWRDLVFVRGE